MKIQGTYNSVLFCCDVATGRRMNMLLKEIAVQLMEHLCNHDWHGYSQVSRWGDGEGTCPVTIGGKIYYLEQGDRDCSSAIVSAFEAAGISCGGASYTGNMRSCMVGTGNFKWHPMSSGYIAQRGDVYLKEGAHTAMCTSAVPDMLAEFSISETGGIDGAEGDQTGRESYIHAYYDYPWDGILECVYKDTDGGSSGNAGSGPDVQYKVGTVYTLIADALRVRIGAGTRYAAKVYSQLTADGKKHAYANGCLKRGTEVTCLAVQEVGSDVWIKIPSGWIAAFYNGEKYVG